MSVVSSRFSVPVFGAYRFSRTMNRRTSAEPSSTTRLRSRFDRPLTPASVVASCTKKQALKTACSSPSSGVSRLKICADAANTAMRTRTPDAFSSGARCAFMRRSGASAPDRTSVASSRIPSTSAMSGGGSSRTVSAMRSPPSRATVRNIAGRTKASRAAVICGVRKL